MKGSDPVEPYFDTISGAESAETLFQLVKVRPDSVGDIWLKQGRAHEERLGGGKVSLGNCWWGSLWLGEILLHGQDFRFIYIIKERGWISV